MLCAIQLSAELAKYSLTVCNCRNSQHMRLDSCSACVSYGYSVACMPGHVSSLNMPYAADF